MLFGGASVVFAVALAGTPPVSAGSHGVSVAPLPPAWTAASLARPHADRGLPDGFGRGRLKVRPGADRGGTACLRELQRLGIPFRVAKPTRGVATPVVVTGRIRGLKLSPRWGNKPALMDCRFALTLYRIAPVALRFQFDEWRYSSVYSYRRVDGTSHLSRHAFGLAIDVFELRGPKGLVADVEKDWIKAPGRKGRCVGPVHDRKARLMRGLVCALEKTRLLNLILTPDSDYAHRDHLHISGPKPGEKPHRRHRYAGRRRGSARRWRRKLQRQKQRRLWRRRRRQKRLRQKRLRQKRLRQKRLRQKRLRRRTTTRRPAPRRRPSPPRARSGGTP